MSANRTAPFLARLHPAADEPDADLVRRYATSRDAVAFEAIVRRHAPLVFGVCRRALGHTHDAEDALQAVFLVFAQKAGTIREPAAVSAWLYGVAVRIAKRAKTRAARRREEPRAAVPDAATMDPTMNDIGPVLDEELAALPAWYRDAVLACDVEELSRTEAAAKLGVPEGTLSSRLAKARKLLAARLARRGITLAVPLATAVANAAVPELLIQQTLETMTHWAAGGAVAKPIAELTHGGMTMLRTVLLLGAGVLTAGAVGIGLAGSPQKPDTKPPAKVEATAPTTEVAKPAARFGPPRQRGIANVEANFSNLQWAADGQRLVLSGFERAQRAGQFGATPSFAKIFKLTPTGLEAPTKALSEPVSGDVLGPHPTDEGAVLIHLLESGGINVQNSLLALKLKTDQHQGLKLHTAELSDDSLTFLCQSADGQALFMTSYEEAEQTTAVHEINFVTGGSKRVVFRTKEEVVAISPDGGTAVTLIREKRKVRVPVAGGFAEQEEQIITAVWVWDTATNARRFQWKLPVKDDYYSLTLNLARDGKTLAVVLDDGCHVFDAVSGREIRTLPPTERKTVHDVYLSHDGRLAVVCEVNATIPAVAGDSGTPMPPGGIPSNRSQTSFVTVYDTASGKAIKKWETNQQLTLAFAPDRATLAVLECPFPPQPGGGPLSGPPGGMMGMGGGGTAATGRLGIWDFSVMK